MVNQSGIKVYDVHGHASAPWGGVGQFASWLLATNTALDNPMATSPYNETMTEEAWSASVSKHVQALDERNIDVQVLGPRPFMMFGWMPTHLLGRWTEFINDTIAHQVSMYPDRFLGACQLPQDVTAQDSSHCIPELDRCVQALGFGAAYLSPDPTGQRDSAALDSTWWDPLYSRCEELDVPLIVHGTCNADQRLKTVPHNYQMAFAAEQYWARHVLGHSDVFDRFPKLRIVICHCGGGLDRFIPTDWHLAQRDLSANLFVDTVSYDVDYLTAAIRQRTVPQMLFGTEAPGSGAVIRPEDGRPADDLVPIIDGLSFLDDDDKRMIFMSNPLKVFPALKGM